MIGTGSWCQVRLCQYHPNFNKEPVDKSIKYAVKIISKKDVEGFKSNIGFVLREVEGLQAVRGHPNFINYHKVYNNSRYFFIVTEFAANHGNFLEYIV